MPIAQVWKASDRNGAPQDRHLTEQLHALEREVARASCQFALEPRTKADAANVEAAISPPSEREAHAAPRPLSAAAA